MKSSIKKLLAGSVLTGVVFSYSAANAVTVNNTATVDIVAPLQVVANNDMDFGKIVQPTSGSVTAVVSDTGVLAGTADYIDTTGSEGTVNISGASTETVSITITDTTAITGLSLGSFTGTFGGQALSGGSLTGATLTGGTDIFNIGSTLTVDSTVATGTHSPSYDVEVTYD
ncbi:MAG: DUF4402 domain-containing protein [Rickettsiales bacterium]|nr:DUF4402 domain-containing protein [Pseudomonadota bacterium]MDA0965599.1 DUF4402 domain-containing protein [Pseudomonadota bacterium]MDG4542923.1 DUF4402 domain-containing protein [Rickettsiales bacterium]MDG4544629.1 DUF4402 domain-containing protein [Rickettsiales bacterium]MDG4546751.1 DUF4402 domain-containing protein [Rickettsiales bacterium]